jgi:hypothetical protein
MGEMRRKLEEAESADMTTQMIQHLQPFLPMLLEKFMPKGAQPQHPPQAQPAFKQPTGIAGMPEQPAQMKPITDEQSEQLNHDIFRLLSVDADFCEHLHQLADFAQSKPDKFKDIITKIPMLGMI